MLPLSKAEFRKQFKYGPCSFAPECKLVPEGTFQGYEIVRCLERIFLKDENGKFWSARAD